MGLIRMSSLRLCNHVTVQFSRFELTPHRKPVEMNSGLLRIGVDLDLLASCCCQTVPPPVDLYHWNSAGQMDGEAGVWTTSGKIGIPPLTRVMGVGRQHVTIM